jgi:hypothetical protein
MSSKLSSSESVGRVLSALSPRSSLRSGRRGSSARTEVPRVETAGPTSSPGRAELLSDRQAGSEVPRAATHPAKPDSGSNETMLLGLGFGRVLALSFMVGYRMRDVGSAASVTWISMVLDGVMRIWWVGITMEGSSKQMPV